MNIYDRIWDILLEYADEGGKFDRKKSSLTPQQHDLGGKTEKEESSRNFRSMANALRKAHKEKGELWYGREGGVKGTRTERLVSRYARRHGIKMSAGNLEHPDYDPEIRGNKGHKIAARKYGEKAATRGQEVTWGKNQDEKEAYAQADHGAKEPTESERVQRLRNRLRRRGHDAVIRKHQKKGRTVVGTLGAGHFETSKDEK